MNEHVDDARRGLAREVARISPEQFGRYILGRRHFLRPHTQLINARLKELRPGGLNRLMVIMPPRSGKSELVCRLLPTWWLVNKPAEHVVIASYAAQLAVKSGRWARRMIREHGAEFGVHLQAGAQDVNDWYTADGGGLRSVGVGGGLTGNDMELGICDDPHKDRAQADSLTYQQAAWEWWTSTFITRRSPGAPVVLVQTRWSPGDLAGRLLDVEGRVEEGGRWTVIHLEAIATGKHEDPLGREPGDPLPHPKVPQERGKLLAHWEEQRASSGADWAALFQGDPQPREGALLTRELLVERIHATGRPEPVKTAVAVDPSGGGRDTAGIIGGYLGTDRRLYWTHDRTAVMSSDQWSREACRLAVEIDADRIIVERNFGGDMAKLAIRAAWTALRLEWDAEHASMAEEERPENPYARFPPMVVEVTAKKGKVLRADPVAQLVRQDFIRLGIMLPELVTEWTTWQSTSSQSPGRIDACVYLAYDLLPVPGANTAVSTASNARRDAYRGASGASRPRRPY